MPDQPQPKGEAPVTTVTRAGPITPKAAATYPVSEAQLAQLRFYANDSRTLHVAPLIGSWITRVRKG